MACVNNFRTISAAGNTLPNLLLLKMFLGFCPMLVFIFRQKLGSGFSGISSLDSKVKILITFDFM